MADTTFAAEFAAALTPQAIDAIGGDPTARKTGAAANCLNATAANLQWSRKALAQVSSGAGRWRIGLIGDSTVYGTGSTAPAIDNNVTAAFAAALGRAGIPARRDTGYAQHALLGGDPRWTAGSGWAQNLGLLFNNSTATALVFAPTGAVTHFDVWYFDNGTANTFSLQIGSGAVTNITPGTTSTFKKATVSTAAGVQALSIVRTGGSPYIAFVEAYNAAVNDVSVLNLGWPGSTAASWVAANYSAANLAVPLACQTYLINLTINDANTGVAAATAQASYQTLITQLKTLSADIALVVPHPVNGNATIATQQQYADMIKALAISNGLPVFDLYGRFGTYAQAQADGFVTDTLHYNALGYHDAARFVFKGLFDVLGR